MFAHVIAIILIGQTVPPAPRPAGRVDGVPVPAPGPYRKAASGGGLAIPPGALKAFTQANKERREVGVGPLTWSPILQRTAEWMARDAIARGGGGHYDSLGRSSIDRGIAFGYPGRIGECGGWEDGRPVGTCDHGAYVGERGLPWYECTGHRRCLLHPFWTEYAFAFIQVDSNTSYSYELFGNPNSHPNVPEDWQYRHPTSISRSKGRTPASSPVAIGSVSPKWVPLWTHPGWEAFGVVDEATRTVIVEQWRYVGPNSFQVPAW